MPGADAVNSPADDELPEVYTTQDGLKKLAGFLRSTNGVKYRDGIEHDKRVQYFKGSRLIECLLDTTKKWPKGLPEIKEKNVAYEVAALLLKHQFCHRSEKDVNRKGFLKISNKQVFEESGYFTWMYSGNMIWANLGTGGIIAIVILFTLLPVWPMIAKKAVWWLSVTFLLVSLSFITVRFVCFLFMWILGYEFWILPNLFDETLGFFESFRPKYVLEKGAPGQGLYRVGLLIALSGFVAWAMSQPTEFDGFIQAQTDFVDYLYSGNILSDVAAHREHLVQVDRSKRFPKIDQLLRELEEDEREDLEQNKNSASVPSEGDHDNVMDEDKMDALLDSADNESEGNEGSNEEL